MPREFAMPPPESVTPDTPLRLEVAARLAFPDGSLDGPALRRLVDKGTLEAERIAGKIFVTLRGIQEMRERSRVPARGPAPKHDPTADRRDPWRNSGMTAQDYVRLKLERHREEGYAGAVSKRAEHTQR